jgi:hypothetical protein
MMWRKSWVGLLVIVGIAAAFRLWQIDSLPPGFHFDESFEGLEAWRILTDPAYRPVFLTGNFGVGPVNAYANALMFGLFTLLGGEAGPTAMRTTAALFGVLGVVATWAAAVELRRLEPTQLSAAFPLFAAALLATLRWHVHFSRMGIEPVIVTLETAAALWLLLLAARTGRKLAWAGCGGVLALGIYTYQGAWLLPLAIAGAWIVLWLRAGNGETRRVEEWETRRVGDKEARKKESPKSDRAGLVVGGVVAAATAGVLLLPLANLFLQSPDLFLLRPAQIATTGAEAATHQNLAESAWAYLLMFVPLVQAGDLDPRRNLPGLAALNLWQAIPFWLGAGLALRHLRRPAYNIPLLTLGVMLLPGVLSEYAPHYHRVLGAAAPVALLGGLGLDWIWRWRGTPLRTPTVREGPVQRRANLAIARWLSVALLAAGAFVAARDYFVRWAALPDLFYAFDVGLWTIGQEIAAQPAGAPIYLTPRTADHPTLAFAWETHPGSHGPPVTFDGRHIFPLTAASNAQPEHYVVIEGEDFRTPLLLPELFPDAAVTRELLDGAGAVYARTYTRPAGSLPQRMPATPASQEIGDGIRIAGYDAQTADLEAGKMLYVQLYWDVDAAPQQDWTVFIHLLPAAGGDNAERLGGVDSQPGAGSLPTLRWQPGWRILDEYQLLLPPDLLPGDYALAIGLYTPADARLPADGRTLRIGEVHLD